MSVAPVSGFTFTAPHLRTLWSSVRRFPFAAMSAAGFALLLVLNNHGLLVAVGDRIVLPVAFGLFASFFATLALGLTAEAQQWPR